MMDDSSATLESSVSPGSNRTTHLDTDVRQSCHRRLCTSHEVIARLGSLLQAASGHMVPLCSSGCNIGASEQVQRPRLTTTLSQPSTRKMTLNELRLTRRRVADARAQPHMGRVMAVASAVSSPLLGSRRLGVVSWELGLCRALHGLHARVSGHPLILASQVRARPMTAHQPDAPRDEQG